jgi:hypothetical protein
MIITNRDGIGLRKIGRQLNSVTKPLIGTAGEIDAMSAVVRYWLGASRIGDFAKLAAQASGRHAKRAQCF